MKIIPAIDIIDGKCVRLSQGAYDSKKIYSKKPLEMAKQFEDAGIQNLHLVDLDGAKSQHIVNTRVLEEICTQTNLKVDFGGGLKSDTDVRTAFECGANQITGGSIAVKNPALFKTWIDAYGADKIILGADCANGKIATNGWTESSDLEIIPFVKEWENKGLQYVICTDISKDGMLAGPGLDLYQELLRETGIQLIASGGVSSAADLEALKALGCNGAIVGKAIYEGKITLKELAELC